MYYDFAMHKVLELFLVELVNVNTDTDTSMMIPVVVNKLDHGVIAGSNHFTVYFYQPHFKL